MQPKESNLDHINLKIDNILEDLKDIKLDLKDTRKTLYETKETLDRDIVSLKLDQAKCQSHWSMVGRTISWGGLSGVLAGIASLFAPHGK